MRTSLLQIISETNAGWVMPQEYVLLRLRRILWQRTAKSGCAQLSLYLYSPYFSCLFCFVVIATFLPCYAHIGMNLVVTCDRVYVNLFFNNAFFF